MARESGNKSVVPEQNEIPWHNVSARVDVATIAGQEVKAIRTYEREKHWSGLVLQRPLVDQTVKEVKHRECKDFKTAIGEKVAADRMKESQKNQFS